MKKTIALVSCLLFCWVGFAQQKFEKESRIKQEDVPENARAYVESLFSDGPSVKWYREESLNGISVEGKTKQEEGIYSIKFTTEGQLLDVELTRSFDDLPQEIQEEIEDYFSDHFDRYRIKKVQVQWVGDADILRGVIKRKDFDQDFQTNYEIEFSGRKDRKSNPYEALFDQEGDHIETQEIIPRNISHLLY